MGDETLSVIEQGNSSDEADSGESDLLTQEVVDSEALHPSDQGMNYIVDKFIKDTCKCTLGLDPALINYQGKK